MEVVSVMEVAASITEAHSIPNNTAKISESVSYAQAVTAIFIAYSSCNNMVHNGIAVTLLFNVGGKPSSTRITTFVPPEVGDILKEWAKSENRTVSNLAATILLNAVEAREPKQQDRKEEDAA